MVKSEIDLVNVSSGIRHLVSISFCPYSLAIALKLWMKSKFSLEIFFSGSFCTSSAILLATYW
ncbi:TPA: hypothetical protein DIC40_04740 [Patescibacteria group bacterium]|nr:hypothetical protein [Candidatus Gracilibacteria bacterium]